MRHLRNATAHYPSPGSHRGTSSQWRSLQGEAHLLSDKESLVVNSPRMVKSVIAYMPQGIIRVVNLHGAQETMRNDKCLRAIRPQLGGKDRRTSCHLEQLWSVGWSRLGATEFNRGTNAAIFVNFKFGTSFPSPHLDIFYAH